MEKIEDISTQQIEDLTAGLDYNHRDNLSTYRTTGPSYTE